MKNYKKLLGSISIVTFSYAASRILGFAREILLAKWAGVSSATDTLDLAFIIPDFLFYLSAGGYLAITLIPLLSNKKEEELTEYFLSLLYGLSIVFISVSLITFLFRNQFANFLEVESPDFFIEIFTPIIFSQTFFFIGAILMAFQYFKDQFLYAAAAPVIYNATIILFGWLNSTSPENTIRGFAVGTLVGSILGHLVIQIIGVKKSGLKFKLVSPRVKDLKEYLLISLPLVIGQSIAVVDEQLFRIFGSLLSVGTVATFRYARRIALLPVGIVAQAVGVASYPLLARLYKNNEIEELILLIKKQISYLFLVSGSLMLVGILNSNLIVKVVYERGAFTTVDTNRVATVFSIIVLAVIPWSLNQIVTRSFYVQQKFWFPVLWGSIVTLLTSLVLVSISKSAVNYSSTIVISLFVYFVILIFTLKFNETPVLDSFLIFDLLKMSLVFYITYLVSNKFITEATFLSFGVSLISVSTLIFVSLKLLKFEYINIAKRR